MGVVRIIAYAGNHRRRWCPVKFKVEDVVEKAVVRWGGGITIPAQSLLLPDGSSEISFIIPEMAPGAKEGMDLVLGEGAGVEKGVEIVEEGEGVLSIKIGGSLFSQYRFGKDVSRPYLFPLIGPTGSSLTSDGPPDHVHHRSCWVAHGDVNGVDNWSEGRGHGRTVHRDFVEVIGGPVWGRITAISDWVSSEGEKILEERREMTFYNLPDELRIVDFDVELRASWGDVRFGDTKEAGLISIRVAESMEVRRGGRITNSYGGVNERETWGKRAQWCSYCGPLDGEWVGISIMDHPMNPRYPTYWHVRDYGLMTANFFGLSDFYGDKSRDGSLTLRMGNSLRVKYRLLLHSGKAEDAGVGELYHGWINPPILMKGGMV